MSFRVLQTVLGLTDQSSGLAESILIDGASPGIIFSGSEMAQSRPAESETTVLERPKNRKPGSSKAQNSKTLADLRWSLRVAELAELRKN
jgi:hypothetical protein